MNGADDGIEHVYHERGSADDAVPYTVLTCPECGGTYDDGSLWWDKTGWGERVLLCECGEQFSLREERRR